MDLIKPLAIRKHTALSKRFPQAANLPQHAKAHADWIVFGPHLSPLHFDDMAFYLGESPEIVSTWKVGRYEVAAVRGEFSEEVVTICDALGLDCAPLADLPQLTRPGLAVFDMDSTAIQIECIDEIAVLAGVGEQVAEVTERAMQGELDFEQSLRQRVGTLKDADESILSEVRASLPLMPEMAELVSALHRLGWKVAVASGGFTYFSDHLKALLDLDYAESNQLEIVSGKLTGQVLGGVVDAQRKADVLNELAEKWEIEPYNTIAVGDGANDLKMMTAAGLGIAYHAKPKVQQQAQAAIRHADLGGVLCILSASLLPQGLSWKNQ